MVYIVYLNINMTIKSYGTKLFKAISKVRVKSGNERYTDELPRVREVRQINIEGKVKEMKDQNRGLKNRIKENRGIIIVLVHRITLKDQNQALATY